MENAVIPDCALCQFNSNLVAEVIVDELNRQVGLGDAIQNKQSVRYSGGAVQDRDVIRRVTKSIMDLEGFPILR